MRHALLSLSLSATLAAAAVDLPAADTGDLRDCLNRLDNFEIPIAEIYASCPDLDERIAATGWSASLPPDWRDQFTEVMLEDVWSLSAAYALQAEAGQSPDLDDLDAILMELGEDPEIPVTVSLWAEFKDWLREFLERFFPGLWDSIVEWFDGLGMSDSVADGVSLAALGLIGLTLVLLIAALAVYAWRHFERRKTPVVAAAEFARKQRSTRISFASIDAAQLSERPRLLLRFLLQELDRQQRLAHAERLTHRELASAPPFTDSNEVGAFERVVRLAELATFGIWQPDRTEFSAVLTDGQLLLRSIAADPR